MALNLINPITQSLEIGQLAGPDDECYQNRTGYEVIVANERYALIPIATEETARIGEEVQVDSMGAMKRGQVVRILSGFQEDYTEQILIGDVNEGIRVLERYFNTENGLTEKQITIPFS
jgi:hypothetical protein